MFFSSMFGVKSARHNFPRSLRVLRISKGCCPTRGKQITGTRKASILTNSLFLHLIFNWQHLQLKLSFSRSKSFYSIFSLWIVFRCSCFFKSTVMLETATIFVDNRFSLRYICNFSTFIRGKALLTKNTKIGRFRQITECTRTILVDIRIMVIAINIYSTTKFLRNWWPWWYLFLDYIFFLYYK